MERSASTTLLATLSLHISSYRCLGIIHRRSRVSRGWMHGIVLAEDQTETERAVWPEWGSAVMTFIRTPSIYRLCDNLRLLYVCST